jgi:hypothetical protein
MEGYRQSRRRGGNSRAAGAITSGLKAEYGTQDHTRVIIGAMYIATFFLTPLGN